MGVAHTQKHTHTQPFLSMSPTKNKYTQINPVDIPLSTSPNKFYFSDPNFKFLAAAEVEKGWNVDSVKNFMDA